MRRSVLAVLLLMLAIPGHASARRYVSTPSLATTTLANYSLGVRGTGWASSPYVNVWIQAGGGAVAFRVRPDRRGDFLVGVLGDRICGRVRLSAVDPAGHLAASRASYCPCPMSSRRPTFASVVLQGARLAVRTVHVFDTVASPDPLHLHRGDVLSIWEEGAQRPLYLPNADPLFLVPARKGQTIDQDCSGMPAATPADCNAGFYWEWVAVRTGKTTVDLDAACRQLHPPCGMPDASLRVVID